VRAGSDKAVEASVISSVSRTKRTVIAISWDGRVKRKQDVEEALPVRKSMGRGASFVTAKRVTLVMKGRMIARTRVVIEVGRKIRRARMEATTARMVSARDGRNVTANVMKLCILLIHDRKQR